MDTEQFAIGTFEAAGAHEFPGLVVGDTVLDLRRRLGDATTTRSLLDDWDESLPTLADAARDGDSDAHALAELRPLPPVMPRQILCAGANYHKHVREIVVSALRLEGDERPAEQLRAEAEAQVQRRTSSEPYMFAGLPSALSGARDEVVLWGPGRCHDWELELAVVIGRGGHDIDESRAIEHVAGYMVSNDISVRDVQQRPRFPMTDFVSSKNRPTFFPTGPYLVPRQFVADPRQLRITLSVNGETMQDESVDDIIYGVETLVAYASRMVGLAAGDMILTGSPAGNAGHHGDRWLAPGDVMDATITGLGTQRNVCVAPPPSPL